jgi:formylglycine-generating enzyme required for sulfatase activity
MAKGDFIRNAVEAMIVVGKDVVPAGNMLFEVGKWLFDKYKEHKVNKRLEDLEQGSKISPQQAAQIAREEIQRQRQNGRTISGEFERQLVERVTMMPAMVNQHIQATLQQAQRYGTQATLALPIGDQIGENERTAFYQSLIPPRAPRFQKDQSVPHYNPQWKLVEMLGCGGFGEVWKIQHGISKKSWAIKFCLDEQSAKLLKREADALTDLSHKLPKHPNIVHLEDIQLVEEPYWLMFEEVEGGTLQSLMQAKPLNLQESLDLFIPIVEAMALVHQAGIIHRDLKPVNILLTKDNIPKIADFGIGKIVAEQTSTIQRTKNGSTMMGYGTIGYMSPEQMMGLPAHFSDDVYSLGVIFWQMLSHTLQLPHFLRDSLEDLTISEGLKTLLIQCIEKPRTKRIQTAGDLLQCLKQNGVINTPSPPKKPEPKPTNWWEGFFGGRTQTPDQTTQTPNLTGSENLSGLRGQQENNKGTPRTFSTMKAGKQIDCAVYEKTFDINGVPLVMVYIPAGTFQMGDNQWNWAKPVHQVEIKKAFYMGKYPVTQKQYQTIMGDNPSNWKGDHLPVESTYWKQAKEFCEKLSKLLKQDFRLPSEAQWEYACRAETTTNYWWGDNMDNNRCWYGDNSDSKTHPVNEKENTHTNPFGLCDMHGNVWEWCEDVWHSDYKGAPSDGSAWTQGDSTSRLLRGGSWGSPSDDCRSAYRLDNSDGLSGGFRVGLLPIPQDS